MATAYPDGEGVAGYVDLAVLLAHARKLGPDLRYT
jgi:hypothetical protein